MLRNAPPSCDKAEILDGEPGKVEGAVSLAKRHPNALITEPDDVRDPRPGQGHRKDSCENGQQAH